MAGLLMRSLGRGGGLQMAWVLLQSGAQRGLQDKKGFTALHHAVTKQDKVSTVIHRQGGRWWLHRRACGMSRIVGSGGDAVIHGCRPCVWQTMVRQLLMSGASHMIPSTTVCPSPTIVISCSLLPENMIESGACPQGGLPLHAAVGEGGRTDIVSLLTRRDQGEAHVMHADNDGRTPLDIASAGGNDAVSCLLL